MLAREKGMSVPPSFFNGRDQVAEVWHCWCTEQTSGKIAPPHTQIDIGRSFPDTFPCLPMLVVVRVPFQWIQAMKECN